MPRARRQGNAPELKVVFDTSVLYTGSASDLVQEDAVELISANSQHSDLRISWYLPEVVRHERQHQMETGALALLPSVGKLERLLGHNLNITEAIVKQRVETTVEGRMADLGLQLLPLDYNAVAWHEVMLAAVYRNPPFEIGETEKGFRDKLVVEGFLQLVRSSPTTPRVCRVALVTADHLLAEAARERTRDLTNVRILYSNDELRSLVNTLVGEVSEEFVNTIREKADTYFFEKGQEEALYYKEKIREKILEGFGAELRSIPTGATRRENGIWHIRSPRFLEKKRQRVSWVSRIAIDAEAYKWIGGTSISLSMPGITTRRAGDIILGTEPGSVTISPDNPNLVLGSSGQSGGIFVGGSTVGSHIILPQEPEPERKVLVASGKSVFDVTWSVTVTTTEKFSSPKIEAIDFVETVWV